ncbi:MAG TPA: pantoate--beta-alanine ligase [Chitinophagaceae bacterium]|nr:pantoate--beta-alanine ligase [Chitinophagaceae bacterium]
MIIFRKIGLLKKYLSGLRQQGKIGFVPTMGALHQGHLQLISRSKNENAHSLCSIFVNPTQFNDPQDFQKYPVTIEADILKLEKQGCDILFLPTTEEIYPGGMGKAPYYELGRLEQILEGKFRPGHFQGVCQVVDILLSITEPDRLYLGQKDYQQCMVIQKMISLTGKSTALRICETVREADGLAMSSRNMRLSPEQRQKAPIIFKVLDQTRKELRNGSLLQLQQQALEHLENGGFRPDYFEFAKADTLEIVQEWDGRQPLVALVAAFLGEIRLIDNMILNSSDSFN